MTAEYQRPQVDRAKQEEALPFSLDAIKGVTSRETAARLLFDFVKNNLTPVSYGGETLPSDQVNPSVGEEDVAAITAALDELQKGERPSSLELRINIGLANLANYIGMEKKIYSDTQARAVAENLQLNLTQADSLNKNYSLKVPETLSDSDFILRVKEVIASRLVAWTQEQARIRTAIDRYETQLNALSYGVFILQHDAETREDLDFNSTEYAGCAVSIDEESLTHFYKRITNIKVQIVAQEQQSNIPVQELPSDEAAVVEDPAHLPDTATTGIPSTADSDTVTTDEQLVQEQQDSEGVTVETPETAEVPEAGLSESERAELQAAYKEAQTIYDAMIALSRMADKQALYVAEKRGQRVERQTQSREVIGSMKQLINWMSTGEWHPVFVALRTGKIDGQKVSGIVTKKIDEILRRDFAQEVNLVEGIQALGSTEQVIDLLSTHATQHPNFHLPTGTRPDAISSIGVRFAVDPAARQLNTLRQQAMTRGAVPEINQYEYPDLHTLVSIIPDIRSLLQQDADQARQRRQQYQQERETARAITENQQATEGEQGAANELYGVFAQQVSIEIPDNVSPGQMPQFPGEIARFFSATLARDIAAAEKSADPVAALTRTAAVLRGRLGNYASAQNYLQFQHKDRTYRYGTVMEQLRLIHELVANVQVGRIQPDTIDEGKYIVTFGLRAIVRLLKNRGIPPQRRGVLEHFVKDAVDDAKIIDAPRRWPRFGAALRSSLGGR